MTFALVLLGRQGLRAAREVGAVALVVGRAGRALAGLDRRELLRSLAHFGFSSIPLALAVSAFTGGILVLMANANVQRYGAKAVLGWAAGYTILREFGPLLLCLVMAGRVGARNAAELASMTVGGQLEGLKGVGVDPFALLVAPRVVASAVAVAALGLLGSLVALLSAAGFSQVIIDVSAGAFFRSFEALLSWRDVAAGLAKTTTFGVTVALVSTHAGLSARGGARAVGQAAATSVVVCAALLAGLDWALTPLLERIF